MITSQNLLDCSEKKVKKHFTQFYLYINKGLKALTCTI